MIIIRLVGPLTVSDIVRIIREASIDEKFDRSHKALLDNRNLVPNFSANSLRQILELSSLAIGNVEMQTAVVSASFMRARIVDVVGATLLRGIRVRAFSQVSDALDWLQVSSEAKAFVSSYLPHDDALSA